jgi:uncharacterized membrane protein (DUF2068 family)
MNIQQPKHGLRIVSAFEAIKGLLVLLAGCGLLAYVHRDLNVAAERLVRHFHLNPASRYPQIFIDLANHITDRQLWLLALAALLYSAVRFIEAYGLWQQRPWAEWFGAIMSGIYVPIELCELLHKVAWPALSLLVVNVAIVWYLACLLYQSKLKRNRARE